MLVGGEVLIDGSIDLLSHLDSLFGGKLHGLGLGGGEDGDGGEGDVLEHVLKIKEIVNKINYN